MKNVYFLMFDKRGRNKYLPWKLTVPVLCLSNIPIIRRTVSLLNGVQVPLLKADCNSSAEMFPDLSLSTLESHNKKVGIIYLIYIM